MEKLIKGVVCGVRVEDVADPLMQKIRYLDKLVDGETGAVPVPSALSSLRRGFTHGDREQKFALHSTFRGFFTS